MFLLDDDNNLVDSECSLDVLDGSPCLIVESSGGASSTRGVTRRNPDYNRLLDLLFQRLAAAPARITAVLLDSNRVTNVPVSDRIVTLDRPYPIDLATIDIGEFRRALGRTVALMYRSPDAKAGGNAQKRIRICLDRRIAPEQLISATADAETVERLATSHAPGLTETEKEYMQKARRGQGQFRMLLLDAYGATCPVIGIKNAELLIASHIKPWNVCTNQERLDPTNGILLSVLIDRLFDRGLITFSDCGTIVPSPCLSSNDREKCHLDQAARLELSPESRRYMGYHRTCVFKSNEAIIN